MRTGALLKPTIMRVREAPDEAASPGKIKIDMIDLLLLFPNLFHSCSQFLPGDFDLLAEIVMGPT